VNDRNYQYAKISIVCALVALVIVLLIEITQVIKMREGWNEPPSQPLSI
jgi:hypothetical protein